MDPRGPGKRYEKRVSNTQQALLGGAWVVLQERGSTYQTMVSRSPFSREKGKGTSRIAGPLKKELIYLGNVTQQYNGGLERTAVTWSLTTVRPYLASKLLLLG